MSPHDGRGNSALGATLRRGAEVVSAGRALAVQLPAPDATSETRSRERRERYAQHPDREHHEHPVRLTGDAGILNGKGSQTAEHVAVSIPKRPRRSRRIDARRKVPVVTPIRRPTDSYTSSSRINKPLGRTTARINGVVGDPVVRPEASQQQTERRRRQQQRHGRQEIEQATFHVDVIAGAPHSGHRSGVARRSYPQATHCPAAARRRGTRRCR